MKTWGEAGGGGGGRKHEPIEINVTFTAFIAEQTVP